MLSKNVINFFSRLSAMTHVGGTLVFHSDDEQQRDTKNNNNDVVSLEECVKLGDKEEDNEEEDEETHREADVFDVEEELETRKVFLYVILLQEYRLRCHILRFSVSLVM